MVFKSTLNQTQVVLKVSTVKNQRRTFIQYVVRCQNEKASVNYSVSTVCQSGIWKITKIYSPLSTRATSGKHLKCMFICILTFDPQIRYGLIIRRPYLSEIHASSVWATSLCVISARVKHCSSTWCILACWTNNKLVICKMMWRTVENGYHQPSRWLSKNVLHLRPFSDLTCFGFASQV